MDIKNLVGNFTKAFQKEKDETVEETVVSKSEFAIITRWVDPKTGKPLRIKSASLGSADISAAMNVGQWTKRPGAKKTIREVSAERSRELLNKSELVNHLEAGEDYILAEFPTPTEYDGKKIVATLQIILHRNLPDSDLSDVFTKPASKEETEAASDKLANMFGVKAKTSEVSAV